MCIYIYVIRVQKVYWRKKSIITLTYLLAILPGHRPLLLHDRLLLELAVISDVRDDLTVLLDSERLRVVRHLRKLSLRLLELGVILDVTLDLRVLRDTLQLRRLRHRRRFCFWYVSVYVQKHERKREKSLSAILIYIFLYPQERFLSSRSVKGACEHATKIQGLGF